MNKRAFAWGRVAASDPEALARIVDRQERAPAQEEMSFDELVAQRSSELTSYQDAAYARRYLDIVARARAAERRVKPDSEDFARAVAIGAYRLMAYKDEYEVARLYAEPAFMASLNAQFSKAEKISLWLAPPLFTATDPKTGRPIKRKFGPWILKAMGGLAKFRRLRGTFADPFGYTHERRSERALAAEFLVDVTLLSEGLSVANHARAVALAELAQEVRGFGPVKEAAMKKYAESRASLQAAPVVHRHSDQLPAVRVA
ncbi:DUF6537 domain-containing protein [Variovorax ginsengisoli]|uniref:DUF6537 domain-containing protein n=1 Tax=Variovorax ginsengisoli TaxID=363844 RepID=A0ABT8SGX1_9BURK|nr:DUF6537 domain-containing protein [Variovorax ginsengisoli]MDN8618969.1 hypothetical protein [Variovorax ginsengisoli]MDO1538139.1 hypothetical protein [Variovorax ginsengisoli]